MVARPAAQASGAGSAVATSEVTGTSVVVVVSAVSDSFESREVHTIVPTVAAAITAASAVPINQRDRWRIGGGPFDPAAGDHWCACIVCSAVADSVTEDRILKVINGGSEAVSFVIQIEGTLPDDGVEGACVVLSGPTLDAVNQDGSPESVCPRQSTVQVKPVFQYVAPAHSLTVLRWR